MPAQPRQQVVHRKAEDQNRPFEPPYWAVHRLRIHAHTIGVQMVAKLLALDLQLTIGLADTRHLLPTTQRMHIQRQALDGRLIEPRVPCRHHSHPGRANLCNHSVPTVAVEMDVRREPRGTLLAITLPCLAMTDGTVVGEQLPPRGHIPVCRLAV